jgi:sulfhydrogenase subunit delta
MAKPRVAIFDFACCEGCQLQIINMGGELLELLTVIDPVEWREAISDQSDEYDIAIIEGSITREEDVERLQVIRKRAKILIALGACATMGGVNKLKNHFPLDQVRQMVYGDAADMPHLNTAKVQALDEVVTVDYKIEGCPIDAREVATVIRSLLAGKTPVTPNHPVCVECKMQENPCRYDYGEICLGPLTRAGCRAWCPSNGFWCFGCRGLLEDANIEAAKQVMEQYGKSTDELEAKLMLFNTKRGEECG